ncbi:hypothetical protein [Bradyrhizobium sp. McL0615]|uniref:hypothetical protein n=1 Tax=Bradyrhizobium sp. McL0615 TaxID=3415673 RepID=UPI003CF0A190
MADDRSLFTRLEDIRRNWYGENDWSPKKTVEDFAYFDGATRADALDTLDHAMAEIDTTDLRQYSEMSGLHRDLNRIHQSLLKVGR